MNLSPANLIGLRARAMPAKPLFEEKEGRRVVKVVMYRCPECRELHEWEDDAEECCKETAKKEEGTGCPVCGEIYETYRDAADCCLWKDIGAYTRWRIADAVEDGSDWAHELEVDKVTAMAFATAQKYDELLFSVGRKFQDESRHETALRYIREAETAEEVGSGCTAAMGSNVDVTGAKRPRGQQG